MASPESREILQQSLEQHRHELQLAVRDLRLAARPIAAPADAIRRRPMASMTAAFLVGLLIGRGREERIDG